MSVNERGVPKDNISIYWCLGERLNEQAERASEEVNMHLVITFVNQSVSEQHNYLQVDMYGCNTCRLSLLVDVIDTSNQDWVELGSSNNHKS